MIKKLSCCLVFLVGFFRLASGQLPSAELHSINPPVIRSGTTTEISLSGVNLDEVTELHFSDPAIKAEPIFLPKTEYQLTPRQDGLRFRVTVPKLSQRKTVSVRAAGYFGLSTSRPLIITPENVAVISDKAGAAHHQLSTAPELPRETLSHGTTDSRQTDWWKVKAKKGERLLVHCEAERIDSQADANLMIVDARGYELESDRDTIGRDPMLDFTAPNDGDYWVGVHDVFYNGGVNFPYLIEVSTRPWIDAVFPPAGKAGETFDAIVLGRNLPGGSQGENLSIGGKPIETLNVKITVPPSPQSVDFDWESPARALLPTFLYQCGNSNPVKIGISDQVVKVSDRSAPSLVPPFEIAARIDQDGGMGKHRFTAQKGANYWCEVIADRIAGNIDPYLLVEKITKDKDGKETLKTVKEGDDTSNTIPSLENSSRDVALSFSADQDGEYQVTVINQYSTGGPEKIYRVSVREARPDFEIVALAERPYLDQRQAYPAAPLLRKGGTFPLNLAVDRKDGFTGDITLTASGLPDGVTCPSVSLPEKETTARLVFAAGPDSAAWNGAVTIMATAKNGDVELQHPVRLGTLVTGVVDYSTSRLRSRLDSDIPLAVSENEPTPARIESGTGGKLEVTLGQKLDIPVKIPAKHEVKGDLTISLEGLRGMVKPPTITIAEKANEGKLTVDFTAKPNVFTPEVGIWNFVLKGTGVTKYQQNLQAVERANAEKTHVEALVKKYTDASNQAKADVAAKQKEMDQDQKNLATASAEAKPELEQLIGTAKTAFTKAQALAASAEAKRLEAEKEKVSATQRAANATKLATVKDVKFASWSLPLVVEVKPAPKPEEKAKK